MLETIRYIAVGKVTDKEGYVVYKGNHRQICNNKKDILQHAKLFKVKYTADRAAKALQKDGFEGHVWEIKCTCNLNFKD